MSVTIDHSNLQELLQTSLSKPVLFYCFSRQAPNTNHDIQYLTQFEERKNNAFVVALVDCDADPELASQFRLQQLPTFYLFQEGNMVDAKLGEQSPQDIDAFLAPYLPNEYEQAFEQAQALLTEEKYLDALPLLQIAYDNLVDHYQKPRSNIAMQLIKAMMIDNQIEQAKKILATIPLQDQDSVYAGLIAEIEIKEQAAHLPELKALVQQFEQDKNNHAIRMQLAIQWMQIGKVEDALELLFDPLKTDVSAADGEIKKALLEMLAALGKTNPLINVYRRKLYTLMY